MVATYSTAKRCRSIFRRKPIKAVTDAIEKGTPISREIADLIANGMNSWAKSLNVTHYTHWFQPLDRTEPPKSMTALSNSAKTAESLNDSSGKLLIPTRTRTLLLSPMAVSVIHSKLADIPHGTFLHRHS